MDLEKIIKIFKTEDWLKYIIVTSSLIIPGFWYIYKIQPETFASLATPKLLILSLTYSLPCFIITFYTLYFTIGKEIRNLFEEVEDINHEEQKNKDKLEKELEMVKSYDESTERNDLILHIKELLYRKSKRQSYWSKKISDYNSYVYGVTSIVVLSTLFITNYQYKEYELAKITFLEGLYFRTIMSAFSWIGLYAIYKILRFTKHKIDQWLSGRKK